MTESDQPSDDLPYALWVQDALRGVVRRALAYTADHGLTGDHHFYITFRTTDDGVHIADYLRGRHLHEMTIVLQHQFWDLEVGTEAFTISLRFGGRLTPLRIPFSAITAFGDPSVNFGLQFGTLPTEPMVPDAPLPLPEPDLPDPAKGSEQPASREPGEDREHGKGDDKGEAGRVIAFDSFRKK